MAVSKYRALVEAIMKSNDPHVILGVSRSGSKEEIDRCYKRVMSKVHPDKNSHPLATKAAQKVNVSRDILRGGIDGTFDLNKDASEFFNSMKEESSKLIRNVKYVLCFIPFLLLTWIVHILNYVLANEWSLTRSSLHSVERTSSIYRIRYFTLSKSSPDPPEVHVLHEYLTSVLHSCRNHLEKDGWYETLLYFPQDDPCTEGKITLVSIIILVLALKIFYNRFIKTR